MLSSAVFWVGLLLLFLEGFGVLKRHQLVSGYLIELVFGLFFSTLLVMLVFSTGMILYAGLFDSEEAKFLLVRPIPTDFVFAFKFQEAMFFSSWGFVLLGTPMTVAYGLTVDAPALFYLLGVMYFVAFSLLPGSVGALVCLFVARFFPRRKSEFFVATIIAIVGVGTIAAYRAWTSLRATDLSRSQLAQFLEHLHLGNLPFMPSSWMSKGMLAASHADGFSRSVFYLLVLLSNALFAYLIAAAAFRTQYRLTYDRVHSHNFLRRRSGRSWVPAIVDCLFPFLPASVRVLIVKDVRTFSRDPVQFSQLLIFTGLVGFYIVALGRMKFYATDPYWRNMISFLNLTLMALFMTAYTSRFIFPLLSLEGQKLWILGLCPISRDSILWSKFVFSAAGASLLTSLLMLFSSLLVRPDPFLAWLQFLMIPILCCGVSGISVGFGARFVDLKQTDPSRIASSFSGTLNLVVCLFFITIVIVAVILPCHLYSLDQLSSVARTDVEENGTRFRDEDGPYLTTQTFWTWMGASIVLNAGLGLAATLVPMRIGVRAFRMMEL